MGSHLRFAGKFTLQSTNVDGQRWYLTPGDGNGLTFPWVKAADASPRERLIVYQAPDGRLRIEMDDQSYLTLVSSLGFVVGTRIPDDAAPMAWIPTPTGDHDGEIELQIENPENATFEQIRYSVDVLLPYLVVDIGPSPAVVSGDQPTLRTFTSGQVSPGLDQMRAHQSARGADLRKVDLTEADLSGVDLSGADLRSAILTRADFRGATLTEATLEGATLLGTDLRGATLDRADLGGTDLSKAIFDHRVTARGANFSGCMMVGVSMAASAGDAGADLTKATFVGAELSSCDLTGAVLRSAHLLRANLTGAILAGVDFTGAQLGGLDQSLTASLAFSYLPNAIFSQANLFGVSFANASLFGAAVKINDTSTIEQADFSNAYLAGIDFSGAVLSGSRFDGCCLVNTNFSGADLTATLKGSVRSSLAGAVLYGSRFQGARLDGADLTNAAVAFERGFLPVRYCAANGLPFPSPPDDQPTAYRETTGLDQTTLGPATICPNGIQWAMRNSRTLSDMLTTAHPPTNWFPRGCRGG